MLVITNFDGSKLLEFTTSLNVKLIKPSSKLKTNEFRTGGVLSSVNTDTLRAMLLRMGTMLFPLVSLTARLEK